MQNTKIKNLLSNVPMLISALALLALNIEFAKDIIFAVIVFVIILFVLTKKKFDLAFLKENSSYISVITALAASAFFPLIYIKAMRDQKFLADFSENIGVKNDVLIIAFAFIGGLFSLYFILNLSALLFSRVKLEKSNNILSSDNKKSVAIELIVCLLSSVMAITICTKSSPLYPFNDWVDSNCFFTVGKSMLSGLVTYRDLLEQKGPILYMLHAIAALISYKDFFGVYVIEILAAFVFLIFCRKILKLYNPNSSLLWLPIIASVVYSSAHLLHGDSAEELSLPFMMYFIYCGLKAFYFKKEISFWEGFFIGVTSACILWIKFTLLGIYVGWFLAFVIIKIKDKKVTEIFKLVGSVAVGIVAVSIPVLIYFALNNALDDLFTVYFYNNLFFYSDESSSSKIVSVIQNISSGFVGFSANNIVVFWCLAVGIIGLLKAKRYKETLLTAFSAVSLLAFIYIGQHFRYYSFVFSAFVPIGIAVLSDLVNNFDLKLFKAKKFKVPAYSLAVILSLAFAFIQCDNTYLLKYDKEDFPQYKFAEIIEKEDNPTLLNYGFLDGGFYTTTGIVPNNRYFCELNIELDEMLDGQKEAVDKGLADFVVTRKKELESENYTLVSTASFFFEEDQTYYLYKLVEE